MSNSNSLFVIRAKHSTFAVFKFLDNFQKFKFGKCRFTIVVDNVNEKLEIDQELKSNVFRFPISSVVGSIEGEDYYKASAYIDFNGNKFLEFKPTKIANSHVFEISEELNHKFEKKDLISVVINCSGFNPNIFSCFSSIVRQGYDNVEIIIAYHNHDENYYLKQILDIIKEHKLKSNIKFVNSVKEEGMSFNIAVSIASGEYVLLMSHEDFLVENALEEFHNACIKDKSLVAMSNGFSMETERMVSFSKEESDVRDYTNSCPVLFFRNNDEFELDTDFKEFGSLWNAWVVLSKSGLRISKVEENLFWFDDTKDSVRYARFQHFAKDVYNLIIKKHKIYKRVSVVVDCSSGVENLGNLVASLYIQSLQPHEIVFTNYKDIHEVVENIADNFGFKFVPALSNSKIIDVSKDCDVMFFTKSDSIIYGRSIERVSNIPSGKIFKGNIGRMPSKDRYLLSKGEKVLNTISQLRVVDERPSELSSGDCIAVQSIDVPKYLRGSFKESSVIDADFVVFK